MKVYIAGPFFNPEQVEIVEKVKSILDKTTIDYYSPKDDCLYTPGGSITPREAFEENKKEIKNCNFIIAITDGLDAGTLFECGYAHAINRQICYLWINNNNQKFNLMLSESASCICYSYKDLIKALSWKEVNMVWPSYKLKGEVE